MQTDSRVTDRFGDRWANVRFGRWFGRYFLASIALFALGVGGGIALTLTLDPSSFAGTTEAMSSLFPDRITFWTLVTNNLVAVGVTALGLVSFGVVAVLSILFNGFIVGILLGGAIMEGELPRAIALIAPHGWLEIGMFCLTGALSLRVTHRLINYLRRVDETPLTGQELFELGVLLLVVAVGIVVAAWIEAALTVEIARALL